jgi:hypothetical protein
MVGDCGGIVQVAYSSDSVYNDFVVPLMFVCAILLPIAYIIGLVFTLKTHAHIVNNPEFIDPLAVAEHGPEGAEWSKLQCFLVLSVSIIVFAFIGEEMVDTIDPTIEFLHISQVCKRFHPSLLVCGWLAGWLADINTLCLDLCWLDDLGIDTFGGRDDQ